MNAASPGVISLFLQNAHYASREDYLAALAGVMRDEYRTILERGWICSWIALIWRSVGTCCSNI